MWFVILMIGATHGLKKIPGAGKGTEFSNVRDEMMERRERQQIKPPLGLEEFEREGKSFVPRK